MTKMSVDIPVALQAFVEGQVLSGDYASAEDVLLAGLRRFQAQEHAEAAKMERFLALVQEGVDELDRGDSIEVTDVAAFLNEIMAEVEAERSPRAA